jgi:hypothetical protein
VISWRNLSIVKEAEFGKHFFHWIFDEMFFFLSRHQTIGDQGPISRSADLWTISGNQRRSAELIQESQKLPSGAN